MYARFIYDETSPALDQWQRILYRLQPEAEDSLLHDVWERARLCDEIPHFGNLCQHTVLGRLKEAVNQRWPDWQVDYFVNAADSHFSVNGIDIRDYWQFFQLADNEEKDES